MLVNWSFVVINGQYVITVAHTLRRWGHWNFVDMLVKGTLQIDFVKFVLYSSRLKYTINNNQHHNSAKIYANLKIFLIFSHRFSFVLIRFFCYTHFFWHFSAAWNSTNWKWVDFSMYGCSEKLFSHVSLALNSVNKFSILQYDSS